MAYSVVMPSACDIVRLSAARGVSIEEVARLYFAVGDRLGFGMAPLSGREASGRPAIGRSWLWPR